MKENRPVVVKKKGFSFLSFFIGLLLGIIIILGALAGGTYFVLTADLDQVLGVVGLDNSKDETGQHKYVNTDTSDGGVKNLLELIQAVSAWAGDYTNLTLAQVDSLVPAARGIADKIEEGLGQFVTINRDELRATKFGELGEYMYGLAMDVRPAALIDAYGDKGQMNKITEVILYGVEANYVYSPNGEIYPLEVDSFVYDEETDEYKREEDGAVLKKSQEQYLVKQSANTGLYDLFHFYYELPGNENRRFIAERSADDVNTFFFTATPERAEAHEYDYMYNEEYSETTGNYYLDNTGEKVIIEPITIGSLIDGSSTSTLDKVLVIELMGDEEGHRDELLDDLLGDMSVADLMNGQSDFGGRVNDLELNRIMDIDPRSNAIMAYFGYGLTDMSKEPDEEGRYTANYRDIATGENIPAYVVIDENGKTTVTSVSTGQPLSGTYVKDVSARVDGVTHDIKIGQLMTIDESNTIMNSIKNSTVDSLPGDIAALSLNELYADSIYGYDQTVVDPSTEEEQKVHVDAKLRLAVSEEGAEFDSEVQIVFNESYLYYELNDEGVYKLVNLANDNDEEGPKSSDNGKLTKQQFEQAVAEGKKFYTYGAPNKLWKLLVETRITEMVQVEEGGIPQFDPDTNEPIMEERFLYSTELAYSVNNITSMVDNVTKNMRSSSLSDLNEAGILKFNAEDLTMRVDVAGTPLDPSDDVTLGELPLEKALGELITLLHRVNTP